MVVVSSSSTSSTRNDGGAWCSHSSPSSSLTAAGKEEDARVPEPASAGGGEWPLGLGGRGGDENMAWVGRGRLYGCTTSSTPVRKPPALAGWTPLPTSRPWWPSSLPPAPAGLKAASTT